MSQVQQRERYITAREVAERVGLTAGTIVRYYNDGLPDEGGSARGGAAARAARPLHRPNITLREMVDAYVEQYDAAPSTIAWLRDNMRPALEAWGDRKIAR